MQYKLLKLLNPENLFTHFKKKLKVGFFNEKIYKLLFFSVKKFGTLFVDKNNVFKEEIFSNIISSSYGHISAEVDFVLRYQDKNKKKIRVLTWPTENVKVLINYLPKSTIIFSDNFFKFIKFTFLIGTKYYKEVSASLSATNFSNTPFHLVGYSNYKFHEYNKFKFIWKKFLLISEKKEIQSLYYFLSPKLKSPFNFKYAVVQIKQNVVNATAVITDNNSYISSIKYLQNKGLKVVFAGSEIIPSVFNNLGVIDYKEIYPQNYNNELKLVNNAEVLITSASGYAYLASVLNKKLLYCNQWSIKIPQPGENTLQVPCRIKIGNKKLSLSEQYNYCDMSEPHSLHSSKYSFIHPNGEIILSSLKELLSADKESFESHKLVKEFRKNYQAIFGEMISRPSLNSLIEFEKN